ncbi:2-succinyl-5-enolpyruvyl-6-hydroxy-3-cyclohexene-1-carboxylate synthase [Agromyces flavus]|uniref:2-succinyl-5-enolpyruvyl-6-hydroxy-3-cyclohexene-1-carboxylate synthase n=1 Tax=Agromyces flavus TaxID=589382 RepID=A0A1H1XTY8_9MICO|nr:2-succinyl-5-enolpyruvyl-6-hydroxy-3-cyclohexene-1-carboxylic-acid synthase [Agromyces flavus]MCP2366508.1 2-succinyl-5-enolpyruvyl-6-hydroxy-3-cyclohexene-1-carboxylate synthase [Agromyces flavus]GGI44816.1 2-succinyl-5-enolpyruvyl-6-hydroxy-3-cyclohexene-1-carboxylate synthase [Agromyces flavus]SDT12687.1 2-succinyl-5-enolpyruvyl-6-hydroxy-3-cyclohexene-1-carboxylate synthase [Agromyces flavus]
MPDARAVASPATASALALLSALVRAGVTDVVVAPGSRSQALALAAAELERAGAIRLHVRIDERGAGFLALGLAVESGRPSVVVTTSGTAVANLHPAVLEAHHGGVPLILATADRPAELRGIRSNQTTMQPGIFAGAVRLERDVTPPEGRAGEADAATSLAREAVRAALGRDADGRIVPHPGPGPVHLNLQLREPLSSAVTLDDASVPTAGADVATSASNPAAADSTDVPAARLAHGPRTIVVAGAGAGPAAEELARAAGWPLIAEVTSGARFGPNLVVAYRELLREPGFGDEVERVVVFGHPTLSREVPALVQRKGVEVVVVAPSGIEWFNPGHAADRFERAVAVEPHEPTADERAWTGRWVRSSRMLVDEAAAAAAHGGSRRVVVDGDGAPAGMAGSTAPLRSGVDETGHVSDFAAQRAYLRDQLARIRTPIDRRMLVEAVWGATWPHDRLVFGASRLIRDADRTVPGRRITVHANRGLAGIDGTVATTLGVAIASQAAVPGADGAPAASARAAGGTTRAIIGDLTLLHDVGSLLIGAGEARPRVLLVVGNDGGGTIFDALEVAASAPSDAFDRVQYTPQQVDLAGLAAAYGWEYRRATTRGELDEALGTAVTGPTLLEVPLAR